MNLSTDREQQPVDLLTLGTRSRPGSWAMRAGSLALAGGISLLAGLAPAWAQTVPLGTTSPFGVLAASAVTSTGASVVIGDLGISPNGASSVTGFPPGQVIGTTHFADAVALQAQNDLTTAYNNVAGRSCGTVITADLGGTTLFPGVYCAASGMGLTGTLTLDAQGDPNAEFIFQMGSTLTTGSASTVQMINGGQNCNVYWQIGSSATLGTGTQLHRQHFGAGKHHADHRLQCQCPATGAEALVRWEHPQHGLLGPGQFIPLAEESGLIVALGEWVLSSVVSHLRQWTDAGLEPLRLSINLASPTACRRTSPKSAATPCDVLASRRSN